MRNQQLNFDVKTTPASARLEEGQWLDEHLFAGDVVDAYSGWPTPALIVSDGAYGVGGFPGDPRSPEGLADWYQQHVEAWSKHAAAATTLWFWNTEIGWATVHPVLSQL